MQTVREVVAGDTMDVCLYTRATRWDGPKDKAQKAAWRKEANRRLSLRLCRERLEQRISCNFGPGDWHIVLTLSNQYVTDDYEVLREHWRQFLRAFNWSRHKRGQGKAVYIYVMEGLHGDKRPHIHVLLNAEEGDIEAVNSLWYYGVATMTPLETFEHRDHLGQYLTKEPAKFGRDYSARNLFVASHNCRKPERSRYSLPDGMDYPVPDGWQVVYRDYKEAPCGRYAYYKLSRIS